MRSAPDTTPTSAPDTTPTSAPDSFRPPAIALDSGGVLAIGIGAAADFFCAAKAAEGASPRTVEWYRMILIRAVRRFGDPRPVDAITAAELRAWLLELRSWRRSGAGSRRTTRRMRHSLLLASRMLATSRRAA